MSNHAHHRARRRQRPAPNAITAAAALTSAARGCTCEPEITSRHTDYGAETVVAHDDWCPARNTGSAMAVIPDHHASATDTAEMIRRLITGEDG